MRKTRLTKFVAGSMLAVLIGVGSAGIAHARVVDLTSGATSTAAEETTSTEAEADPTEETTQEDTASGSVGNVQNEVSARAAELLEQITNDPDSDLPHEVVDVLTAIAQAGNPGDYEDNVDADTREVMQDAAESDLYKEIQPRLQDSLNDPEGWNELLRQLREGANSIDTDAINDALSNIIGAINNSTSNGTSATADSDAEEDGSR